MTQAVRASGANDWSRAAAPGGKRTRVRGGFCFQPGFAGFAGHFPDQPLVPGVCLAEAARLLAEFGLGRPCRVRGAESLKFLRMVLPGECIQYVLDVDPATGGLSGDARSADGIVLKYRLQLEVL